MNMADNGTHSDFNNLVTRYLSGELSAGELKQFEQMLETDSDKRSRVEEFRKIWDSVGAVSAYPDYDLDSEWDSLRQHMPDFQVQKGRSRSLLYYSYRIAAALLVGLIFAFAWIYSTRYAGTELVMANLEPVEVSLDDGTRVLLNRGSKIRYNKDPDADMRNVRLTGEAWFDVARDSIRPFVIDAGSATIEVLGTRFNVNAYRENTSVEITVESGIVALTSKQDQMEQIVLRAGNGGTYDRQSKQLELIPSSDPNNISWKTRELFFENSTLEEVVELVNRVYNARVVIVNEQLLSCPITVTFRDQSLESVLNVLEVTMDLEISRSGEVIRLNGPGCTE